MVDREWRRAWHWPELLRTFASKLTAEGRDINEGYYALLIHSADEIEALRAELKAATSSGNSHSE